MDNKLKGTDIYIISRHSNWSPKGIEKAFADAGIYPQKAAWKKFIEITILTLGVAFLGSGIIFFFAYNWATLHRFVKLGIVEGLIAATVAVTVFSKLKPLLKDILLTGASLLVGCLFAVFGQVYQTGANAYDFFLGWTAFVALWCLAAGFAPLWLLFLALVNITFGLYADQVARDWHSEFIITIFLCINAVATIIAEVVKKEKSTLHIWFIRIAALAAASIGTIGVCGIIFSHDGSIWSSILVLLTLALFALGIWRSLQMKHVFYLTVIPLGAIIMAAALLVKMTDNEYVIGFFLAALFVAVAITVLIKQIIKLNRTWHEQPSIH